jgi:hypothetical protein
MPRFDCLATINWSFVVTANTEAEAEAVLTEALGPDWGSHIGSPDLEEDPRIEEGLTYDSEVTALGLELVPG